MGQAVRGQLGWWLAIAVVSAVAGNPRSADADPPDLRHRFLLRGGWTTIPWTVDSMHRDEDGALLGLAWSRFWQPLHVGLAAEAGGGMSGPSFTAAALHLGATHRIAQLRGLASAEAGLRRTSFTCFALFADGDPCHHAYATGFIGARGELNLEGSRWGGGLWFSVQHDTERSAYDRWVFGGTYVQLGLQLTFGLRAGPPPAQVK